MSVNSPPPDGMSGQPLPEMDFISFVMSLATSAILHIDGHGHDAAGDHDDAAGATPHLPLAKQTIEIIGMLREKTRGNLTSEEERMLENVLYDLRIRYLRATGR